MSQKTPMASSLCSLQVGMRESEQLPVSTVVTPCCGIGSQSGSQKSVGSRCVWMSMKPGATIAPPASIVRSPACGARSGPISMIVRPLTRTSASKAAAPLPSTMLPPRISRSAMLSPLCCVSSGSGLAQSHTCSLRAYMHARRHPATSVQREGAPARRPCRPGIPISFYSGEVVDRSARQVPFVEEHHELTVLIRLIAPFLR